MVHQYEVELDAEVTVVAKVYWGDAREKIVDYVGDLKLDALVMGTRGLGAIQRYYYVVDDSCAIPLFSLRLVLTSHSSAYTPFSFE
ncbi:putative rossmann-like alpha/beta/alpha sandwich protein [Medicago truncatula]|uniref:Putative rossmann-like alpha/beta/alpha sandwich protein n=1 Tax=Medicago truncatula TaxID=3880 RepID=A0A396HEY9_MEDTR|nr:putative rossmann-like alpha/beta/alpha sandwich protein [Medicago truncatula]